MVLSTTGFGSPVKTPAAKPSHQQPIEIQDDAMSVSSASQEQPPLTQMQGSRLPYPRFDMNLRDLFTDDETTFRQFVRPSMNVPYMMQQQQATARQTTSNPAATFSPSLKQEEPLSATTDLSNMQLSSPTLSQAGSRMQQQAQQPSSSIPLYSQISNQMPYAQNISSTYPDMGTFSDFDWLDSFPVGSASGAPAAASANLTNSDAMATAMCNGEGGLGELDLGFGMGWEGHDWADRSSFDLFDGFFFGSGAGS